MDIKLQYDTPVQVTKEQYNFMQVKFAGIIAHRFDQKTGVYYIKIWRMKYIYIYIYYKLKTI
jgi:hypothetical protein